MRNRWLYCLFLFLPSIVCAAKPIYFKRIPGENGINSNYVNELIQRRDGFIWMATADGLSRYDGYEFVNYASDPNDPSSLPDPWVEDLLEDHQSRLWVGTSIGLARLQADERSFVQYLHSSDKANSIISNQIQDIFEDQANNLWIATNSGLSLYQPIGDNFKNFFIDPENKGSKDKNSISFITQTSANELWVGNEQGLFRFDIQSGLFHKQTIPGFEAKKIGVQDAAPDQKGSLWLATEYQGVIQYDYKNHQSKHYAYSKTDPNSIISNNLWRVLVDKQGVIWVGTWGEGISSINPSTGLINRHKHNIADSTTIPNNLTTDIFEDAAGSIWLATYDGVALHQPNNPIENVRPIPGEPKSLSSDTVWSFEESADAIWVGTTEGLNRWDKKNGTIEKFYSGQESDDPEKFTAVWAMAKAGKDKLWLGTEFGPALFNTSEHSLEYLYQSLPQQNLSEENKTLLQAPVWVISKSLDKSVWIGTNASELYRVDARKGVLENHSKLISTTLGKNNSVEFTNIVEDDNRNLWLSTSLGLFFFNTHSNTISPVRTSSKEVLYNHDWIYAIQHHQANQYWVSSQNSGLSLLQFNLDGSSERLLHINQDYPNVIDKSVYSVYPVNDTEIWFNGSKNLYKLDMGSGEVENFGSSYFQSDITFHENTQYFDSDGFLYLGSSRGAIRFKPNEIKKTNYQAQIYMTSVSTNNLSLDAHTKSSLLNNSAIKRDIIYNKRPLHQLKKFVFPYSETVFNFGFSALDFSRSDAIHYSYRLVGLEKRWTDLGKRRKLTFSNLDAGNYQLEIKATNGDLEWSKHQAIFAFTIQTKPWFSWWAWLIYTLVILVFSSTLYRFWRRHLLTRYALNESEVQLSQALWGSGDELWEWDIQGQRITRKNTFEILSERSSIFTGQFDRLGSNIHPEDLDELKTKIGAILNGKSDVLEAVYRQKDKFGNWVWLLDRAKVTKWSDDKKPKCVSGTSRNITQLKQSEEKNRLLASAFQNSTDGAIVVDIDFIVISINSALTRITGFGKEIIDRKLNDKIATLNRLDSIDGNLFVEIKETVIASGSFKGEVWLANSQAKKIPIELRVGCVMDSNNRVSHFIVTMTDIMFRKQAEEELRKLANFDDLTGLANRTLLLQQLSQGILRAQRDNNSMAVMFLDLDHFKNVNDSLGHSIGDELLVMVARRLTHCVRKTDTVARLGGDEFTVGLFGVKSMNAVVKIAELIVREFARPFVLKQHELIITPSIGIAVFDEDGTDIDTLLRHADTAMYHAKNNGRNNFQFFAESMNKRVINRAALETRLRKALKNNEFVLHYQPKFNLKTRHISGFEALIRWQDPVNGMIMPDDFIPVAEETGLILPIGLLVLDAACRQLRQWCDDGYQSINLAVNLSALQFMDTNIVQTVRESIDKYQIQPQNLELEITESTLIENMEYTIITLQQLRNLGVKLSLDDFGTGYSSLSYLKQFPIHALKIDRSFIKDMANDQRDAKIVQSIVSLAHNLSVSVVGEGVESVEQLNLLNQFDTEEVQGFLMCKPVDVVTANQLLSDAQSIEDRLQTTMKSTSNKLPIV